MNIDHIIVCIFLLINLCLGLYVGRGMSSIKDFAVGQRRYSSYAILATMSASFIGGGYTFGISEKVFRFGIVYFLCILGVSLQQIFVAKVVAPRMGRFRKAISVGDMMAQLYDKKVQVITGVAGAIVCTGIIGAQVGAIGYVFNTFLGIDKTLGIIIGCGIVISYSVFGGLKAVVATDLLQFSILLIAIPLTLYFGIEKAGGLNQVMASLPVDHLNPLGTMATISAIALFLSFLLGEMLVPPYIQRLFIAKDEKTTQRGVMLSGLISAPFFAIACMIGLVAYALNPDLQPTLALPHVLNEAAPVGLKGIAIAGIIAVVMSSADSYLNAAAVCAVHDVMKPLASKQMSAKAELRLSRIFTFAIGTFAVVFALSIESLVDILLYSYNFWAPMILVPFVAGVLGYTITPRGFIYSALAGVFTVIVWNYWLAAATDIEGLVIGIFANMAVFAARYAYERFSLRNPGVAAELH